MKRLLDLICSALGLMVLSPILLFIAVLVLTSSSGGIFYRQVRVGRHAKPFRLFKFRSMRTEGEERGQLTTAAVQQRITPIGRSLRKYKLDELPQLLNVLLGDMSLIGPRPEVPKYVELYSQEQRRILEVRPGMTSKASVEYIEEEKLLAAAQDPERVYIDEIMPNKIRIDLAYVSDPSVLKDLKILGATITKLIGL